jgi:mitochondrial fission protein ELM1
MTGSPAAGTARSLRVWYMTTGEAGTHQQARGLARELSADAEEHLLRVNQLWALMPPSLFSLSLLGVSSVSGRLGPPWPDVLVTCGRRSALAAMAVQRRNRRPMVTIHIQPPTDPSAFDLVVAMAHDQLTGENVVHIPTALHGIRAETLADAASRGDPRFDALPRPWTGVLVGGSTRRSPFAIDDANRLADQLDNLRADRGALLITPSRRTPATVIASLRARYDDDPTVFIWDGHGPNPYLSILALSDRLVATSDSISMISEALATLAEVWIFDVPGRGRHARFVADLVAKGLAANLGGAPPPKRRTRCDATPGLAAHARRLVAAKLDGADFRSSTPVSRLVSP